MILDFTISLPVHAGTIVNPQSSIFNGVAFLYNRCFRRRTRLSEKMRLLGHANNKFGETPEIVAPAAAPAFFESAPAHAQPPAGLSSSAVAR